MRGRSALGLGLTLAMAASAPATAHAAGNSHEPVGTGSTTRADAVAAPFLEVPE
ncbi:hypothetical protein [Actinoplanes regularis]|uniref:hypothetical protein n=1 Tax=Actinoplanes regularis TaxID=52697 RepID=UPI0024A0A41E|nr:hypothetical protein [Actinoplanes regularis]GLW35787.1 hypothetical protein Areg01_87220 [Actinoplanes regularis]